MKGLTYVIVGIALWRWADTFWPNAHRQKYVLCVAVAFFLAGILVTALNLP